jgi:hypothetical protein
MSQLYNIIVVIQTIEIHVGVYMVALGLNYANCQYKYTTSFIYENTENLCLNLISMLHAKKTVYFTLIVDLSISIQICYVMQIHDRPSSYMI